jgi:hypothetical protein
LTLNAGVPARASLPDGQIKTHIRQIKVQYHREKYSAFDVAKIKCKNTPSRPTRGALRGRHERGMGCDGRESVGAPLMSQGELNLVSDWQARRTNDVVAYGKTVWS